MERAHLYAVWHLTWDGNAGKCWVWQWGGSGWAKSQMGRQSVGAEAPKTGCNLDGLLQRGRNFRFAWLPAEQNNRDGGAVPPISAVRR